MKYMIVLMILFSTFATPMVAQTKIEREYRVKRSEVPEDAREWLNDSFEGFKRVRWYLETGNQGDSYEAKFKYDGNFYSVKFDIDGNLVDVEYIIEPDDMPEETRNAIFNYLDSNFKKHRIIKMQKQLLGSADDMEDYLDDDEDNGITKNFEIVFHGVTETQNELWEGLFDNRGNLILLIQIEQKPTFNLDY